jgi:uncharacterized phage protein (TIGR01671 family)
MREIKFRGKSEVTGEWAYGYYQKLDGNHYIKVGDYLNMIIPESVGEYTGLPDKNGKEIYEGDILGRWEDEAFVVWGMVKYCDDAECWFTGSYYLSDKKGCATDWAYEDDAKPEGWQGLEVIGNVYEDPELLDVFDESMEEQE